MKYSIEEIVEFFDALEEFFAEHTMTCCAIPFCLVLATIVVICFTVTGCGK